ncbi:MAG: alkaline phosphatase PhoX [Longimicrobiales bacterium]
MLDRRGFLRQATLWSSAALAAPSLGGLAACSRAIGSLPRRAVSYGPLIPTELPELHAPESFRLARLSVTGRQSAVNPQLNVRYAFDGMACFDVGDGRLRLIRNHEIRDPAGAVPPLGEAARSYDPRAGGGTMTLELTQSPDGGVELVREFVSLSGTYVNCAGGPTPWGSWISCEETTAGPSHGFERAHGYCFEVPVASDAEVEPVPLTAMGRFVHEAIAVDPESGTVFLTEDMPFDPQRNLPGAGFYRFIPAEPARLAAGGRLQMLAVRDAPAYDTTRGQSPDVPLPVAWVDIPDPDPAEAEDQPSAVFLQGVAGGGAIFQRLEGCWHGDGNIYFNATSGGDAAAGQVWAFRPRGDGGTLTLIFESPGAEVLDSPDNICVSPRGGLVICEDGAAIQFLRGLTPDGWIFDFVRTTSVSSEFAGACFAPNGRTLFFNVQGGTVLANAGTPGGTYAIWGPWEAGAL